MNSSIHIFWTIWLTQATCDLQKLNTCCSIESILLGQFKFSFCSARSIFKFCRFVFSLTVLSFFVILTTFVNVLLGWCLPFWGQGGIVSFCQHLVFLYFLICHVHCQCFTCNSYKIFFYTVTIVLLQWQRLLCKWCSFSSLWSSCQW